MARKALAIYHRLGDKHKIGRITISLAIYAAGISESYSDTVALFEEAITLEGQVCAADDKCMDDVHFELVTDRS